jgi:hypothetical protein
VNGDEQGPIVQHLRRIDEKVDRVLDDVREIKQRLSSLEVSVARFHADISRVHSRKP